MDLDLTFKNITREQAESLMAAAENLTFPKKPTDIFITLHANNLNNYTANPEQQQSAPAPAPVPAPVAHDDTGYEAGSKVDGLLVDSRGVPFNSNFHASETNFTEKGHWRQRRGCDKVAKKAYEDQYINASVIPEPAPVQQPETAPVQQAPTLPTLQQPAPTLPTLQQPVNRSPEEFSDLYGALANSGALTEQNLPGILEQCGAVTVAEFMENSAESQLKRNKAYGLLQGLQEIAA